MEQEFAQYGIGGVVAMSVLKLIDYLTRQTKNKSEASQLSSVMVGLEKAIKEQTAAIKDQTKEVTQLYTESRLNTQALQTVARDTAEIRSNCPRFIKN